MITTPPPVIRAGRHLKRMTSIGVFTGVLVTLKPGTGSAACHINASITFQKHGTYLESRRPMLAQRLRRHITTKDHLVRSLRVMSSSFGSVCAIVHRLINRLPSQSYCRYSFTPQSWILPSEYTKFMRDYYQEREKDESCLFIAKPADLSRGRSVSVIFVVLRLFKVPQGNLFGAGAI